MSLAASFVRDKVDIFRSWLEAEEDWSKLLDVTYLMFFWFEIVQFEIKNVYFT